MILILSAILCPAIIHADTIYLNDGRELEGIASKSGDKVIVMLPKGQKLIFSTNDILYIAKGPVQKESPTQITPKENPPLTPKAKDNDKTPTSKPDSDKDKPVIFDDDTRENKIPVPESSDRFSSAMNLGSIDPAQILYEYLRKRPAGPGSGGPGLEELIKTARIRIHDKERKVGLNWLSPADFIRRREAFENRLAEAMETYKQAKKIKTKNATPKEKHEKQALMKKSQKKLYEAAKNVADPFLRRFLMGVAFYNSGQYNSAVQMFARCRNDAPIIAGCYQGLGNSLIEQKQYQKAINCLVRAFMLTDDQATALAELKQAVNRSPGTLVTSPELKNARRFIDRFSYIKPRKLSKKRQYWLLPDRAICVPYSLPQLDYDRLVVRQGVGVPITDSRLIVGKDIVKNAEYVIVRLTNWLYLPAKVEKLGSSVEMVILNVADAQFNPMPIGKNRTFKKGEYYNALAADIFPTMSSDVQTREINIKSSYGMAPKFDGGLLPGQGTAPLIDSSGNLVGFVSGMLKTDVETYKNKIIPITTSSKFLKKVKRKRSSSGRRSRNAGKKRIRVPGKSFIFFAIGTEKFEE